ncbi:hypothetical protein [Candidatus Contendibacter odensensis]|uniref:Uncharacterized protein n=1 Tax=Candidatus Contendobacter odensis Run_B_J11 TaxID=1400861 RepID=A0A7U7GFY6_9GAMM|nr:hypothetical protein [Candidatus Contendobacter odensis]CDH47581.1 hypothetical protein BN874_840044 [Candidatus Contendobacter odensis Run_B_J11]
MARDRPMPTWRVTAPRFRELMKDTHQGCRIYEILLMTRPRDLIPYLDVIVTSGWDVKEGSEAKRLLGKSHPYAHFVQFTENSELGGFWLARVRGKPFRKYINKLIAMAKYRATRLRADPNPLIQVDIHAFDEGTHQWDQAWLDSGGRASYPKSPHFHRHYSDFFYHALECLLALPAIHSFGHMVMTNDDYQTLQLACLEQHRRGGPKVFLVHGSHDYPPFDHGMEFDKEAYRVVFPNIPQWFYEASAFDDEYGRYDLRLADKPIPESYTTVPYFKIKIRKVLLYSFSSERTLTGFHSFNHPDGWSVHIREEFPDLVQDILALFPDLTLCPGYV